MNLVSRPDGLLTLDDWIALPEDNSHRYELAEGVLIVSPRPILPHQRAGWRLAAQLEPQLPDALGGITEAELVLGPGSLPTVRVPDVLAVSAAAIDAHRPRLVPDEVSLAVEILSDGSRRMDRVTKFAEYSEAGIDYYWLIDLDEPVSLTAFHLIGEFYETVGEFTGKAVLQLNGSAVTIDLPALTSGRAAGQAG